MNRNMQKSLAIFMILMLLNVDICALSEAVATLTLPSALQIIEEEAFYGNTSIDKVIVPDGATEIRSKAFANSSLAEIKLPESLESLADDAFSNVDNLKISAPEDSYAYNWAVSHGYISNEFTPAESFTYSIEDGEAIITGYTGSNEVVSIPSTIQNIPVVEIGENAFKENSVINKVVFPYGLRSIGNYAFVSCSNLQCIVLPDTISYIGEGSFSWCESLEQVVLPDQLESLGDCAFYGCSSLCEIILPGSIKDLGYGTFGECSNLYEIIIPEGVTELKSELFIECSSLKEVILPDSLTTLGDSVFYRCENLILITIPASVRSIDTSCFANCFALSDILVEEGNKNYCSVDGVLFTADKKQLLAYPCGKGVRNYIIPESVETIASGSFFGIQNLAQVSIPQSVVSINSSAFYSPNDLIVNIYSRDVEFVYNPIYSEGELRIRGYEDSTARAYAEAYDIPFEIFAENTSADDFEYAIEENEVTITGYTGTSGMVYVPVTIEGYPVTKIGDSAFESCNYLESINIPYGVKSIGASAFAYCEALVNVSLSDSLTEIGEWAFSDCYSLTEIELPDSLTVISEGMFCWAPLGSITIPEGIIDIGDEAFCGCGLTEITIPDSVESIGSYAFAENYITSITIPKNVSYIGGIESFDNRDFYMDPFFDGSLTSIDVHEDNKVFTSVDGVLFTKNMETLLLYPLGKDQSSYTVPNGVQEIAEGAFAVLPLFMEAFDYRLKKVQLPETLTTIGDYAFECQKVLSEVNIPEGVTSIGMHAFSDCDGLKAISIPSSMRTIGKGAFEYSGLTDIDILNGVTTIEDGAFYSCKITSISIPASVACLGDDAFDDCDALEEIIVDSANESFSSANGVLFNKDMTTLLLYPRNKISKQYTVPNSVVSITPKAFYDCANLEGVTISKNVTAIKEYTFDNCDNLAEVTLEEGLLAIDNSAFSSCNSLSSIKIPKTVETIGEYAFAYCDGLTKVILPASVTSIGNDAFYKGSWAETTTTFYVIEGSYAHNWCKEHDKAYSFHVWTTGISVPGGTLYQGDPFELYGNVHAVDEITNITGRIYNSDGTQVLQSFTVKPNSSSYNLNGPFNYNLKFGQLAVGEYIYEMVAASIDETKTLIYNRFSIASLPLRIIQSNLVVPSGLVSFDGGLGMSGTIRSNYPISEVKISLLYQEQEFKSYTAYPNVYSYNLDDLNNAFDLTQIPDTNLAVRIEAKSNGQSRLICESGFLKGNFEGDISNETYQATMRFAIGDDATGFFGQDCVNTVLGEMDTDKVMLMALKSRTDWFYGQIASIFNKGNNTYLVELYEKEICDTLLAMSEYPDLISSATDVEKDMQFYIMSLVKTGSFFLGDELKALDATGFFSEETLSTMKGWDNALQTVKDAEKILKWTDETARGALTVLFSQENALRILDSIETASANSGNHEYQTAMDRIRAKYTSQTNMRLLEILDIVGNKVLSDNVDEIMTALIELGADWGTSYGHLTGGSLYSLANLAIDVCLTISGADDIADVYEKFLIQAESYTTAIQAYGDALNAVRYDKDTSNAAVNKLKICFDYVQACGIRIHETILEVDDISADTYVKTQKYLEKLRTYRIQ